ncbi:MAG: hypothetical protein JJE19_04890 [Methanosarcinales archaeon]|nr:hypothetical protein [Methanosarcinales archaeon]
MKTCPRGAIRLVPYSFPRVQRDEGLAGIKARLNALGSELEEIQKSIEALYRRKQGRIIPQAETF